MEPKRISHSSLKMCGPLANIFGPKPFIVKSLKEPWDGQSLIAIANCTSPWTFNVQSFI